MNRRACMIAAALLAAGCGSGGNVADGGDRDLPVFVDIAAGDLPGDGVADISARDVQPGDTATDAATPGDQSTGDATGDDAVAADIPGDPGHHDALNDGGDTTVPDDPGSDTGPGDPPCTRATACGAAATCNLSSGLCEARSPGWTPFVLASAYPVDGAPDDMIVIDGANFGFGTSVTVGGKSLSKNADENRIVAFRGNDSAGTLKVGGTDWPATFTTSASFASQQACGPGDPAATGVNPDEPFMAGPWAAGFADHNGGTFGAKIRVYYPATCGGLRKPPADGKFPFVYFVHGDGYLPLNFEYLARHLATWGFISAIPDNPDYTTFNTGRTNPGAWFSPLGGHETDSDAVIVCHSKGAEYTYNLGLANVRAVVFLGPVYTMENTYYSLFPIQGLVVGWSADGRMNTDKCPDVWEQLETPKYAAMIIGGSHGQFLDDKMWDPPSDGSGQFITRNRQHELTQAFVLPYMQRVFGQAEAFPAMLSSPGLTEEITFQSKM